MTVFYILVALGLMLISGAIGYLVATKETLKELNEIRAGLDRIVKGEKELIDAADAAISECMSYIQSTYDELVRLRDDGGECLDELIGNLGQFLDSCNCKEDDSE